MDIKLKFFFYLAAAIVWGLAALGNSFKVGKRGMVLVPFGLLLWIIPTVWDVGEAAF